MGIPDTSLFSIIEKIKSWIWWGEEDKSGIPQGHWNSSNMCCECKVQLMDFSLERHCGGCDRTLCQKCLGNERRGVGGGGGGSGGGGDLCVRLCKNCESKRRIDPSVNDNIKSFQSEHLLRFLEGKRHGSSTLAMPNNSMSSSVDNLSPVSFRRSPSRSDDDDLDESGKHFFSPLSEYYRDIYDMDSNGVNARHEFSSNKSADSSPFDSPSRMTSTPRSGTSLQQDQEGSPLSLNDVDTPVRQQAMINSKRSEAGFDENPDYGSDEVPRLRDQDTKVKQPMDYVSNGLIWLPPPPEDEEDEMESSFFDDDDEDDELGDSGMFTTSSFGTDIFPIKGKTNEEQKEPLLAAVRGHFRALVLQLLQGEGIDVENEDDDDSWLNIVTSLAWQAAHFVKPDTRSGGSMDPGDYVKVKRVESGTPSESALIKGVVCTKNIKHKRMTSQYKNPKVLLLGGALEYQRTSNHLASFDTLLQQEIDHLKMVVSKIEAHHPNVLLVEKTVSSYAQDYLLEKDISLVLNVKRSLLERVARCTGAQIVHSVDNISSTQLGHCEVFRLERVVEGVVQQPNKKSAKTLMYFEGCPRRLGCTVLLRGAHAEVLQKVKRVVQYAVFAAYHLSLETSFIADEGATLLKMPPLKSQIDFSGRMANGDGDISLIPNPSRFDDFKKVEDRSEILCECSMSGTSYCRATSDISARYGTTGYSTEIDNGSPCLHSNSGSISASCTDFLDCRYGNSCDHSSRGNLASDVAQGRFYQSECKDWRNLSIHSSQLDLAEITVPEEERMTIHHWDSAIDNELIRRNERVDDNEATNEYLSAVDSHQSILVSLSSHCVLKGVLCERSQLLRIKFYGNFDKPLGRYLRDELFNQTSYCRSCKEPTDAHVRCYTHQQGSLTINVRRLLKVVLPGEHDGKIWMWHRCLKCAQVDGVPPANRRVLMSDAAWGLSFGKFLELSFSNHATANRVASCGHSLQRDCLRFYGCGSMVAFFRYSPIDILSVRLPPLMLEFSSQVQQEWVKHEAMKLFNEMEVLFADVFDALHKIEQKSSSLGHPHLNSNEFHDHINDLKVLLKKERNEYESLLHPACTVDPHYWEIELDTLELNLLRRCLLMDSYIWDHRLYSLDSLLKNKASVPKIDPHILEAETYVKLKEWRDETFFKDVKPDFRLTVSDNPKIQLLSEGTGEYPTSNEPTVDQLIIKSVENYCLDNSRLNSDLDDKYKECNVGEIPENERPSVLLLSPASCLSDKIDSAWTGTGQELLKPQGSSIVQPDFKKTETVGVLDQIDNPMFERLKAPVRVHSFDSAMRIQEKIRQGSSPSMRLTSLRSFHASGEFRSMVRDPIPSILRTLSQVSSKETQKLSSIFNSIPLFIPSASKLAAEGVRLLLPQTGRRNIVVPVYDNEPTSVVAYTLASKKYEDWVADKLDEQGGLNTSIESREDDLISLSRYHSSVSTLSTRQSFGSLDSEDIVSKSHGSDDTPLTLAAMLSDQKRSPHFKTSFEDEYSSSAGKVKFSVICYFARQFDALRKECCPSEVDFIRSLSRCSTWNAQGGKSNVYFAKTFDERFIVKQVTKTELDSFEEFAPQYFKYLTESINSGSPTCLAKILGLYQVTVKHLKGGKQTKMELMVMENLFYKKRVTRVYDLKGSARSRYNADTTGKNTVLLDTNLLETLRTNPIFLGSKAKRTLERAVWNDTSFLASVDVMDYSLLVGVDQEGKELVLGIIDFMRQYTWDKHLETWVKASGILGGPKNAPPTVISPLQYKKRFRKAMSTYFLTVPDQWSS